MQLARVLGKAHAVIKHPALGGWRLLLVQPEMTNGKPDGNPLLAIDNLGGSVGDVILLTTDGAAVRDIMGRPDTPVRYAVIGIQDRAQHSADA